MSLSLLGLPSSQIQEKMQICLKKGVESFEITDEQCSLFSRPLHFKISNIAMSLPEGKKISSLASPNANVRQEAMSCLSNAIEQAARLKVPHLVVYPGCVEISSILPSTDSLDMDTSKKEICTPERLTKRKQLGPIFVDRLCKSLFETLGKESDIVVCIPPARHYLELPLLDELEWIIGALPKIKIAYWHSTAHCYFQEKNNIADSEAWLARYSSKMAGVHLEDAAGNTTDNARLLPGMGEINFKLLKNYLPASAIRVLRADFSLGMEPIFYCLENQRELFCPILRT